MTNTHAPPLPLPNPEAWMTKSKAAELMGCSTRTIDRFIDSGTLAAYRPQHGRTETPHVLLWAADVEELDKARRRVQARRG